MDTRVHGSKLRLSGSGAPRPVRWVIMLLELGLVILIAYQLAGLVFTVAESDTTGPAPHAASRAAAASTETSADLGRLLTFDPFFRAISDAPVETGTARAPESTLKIELFGLRAMGDGKGSAIVKMQGGEQKLVQVGDRLSSGVTLAGVYYDRLEINRGGSREAVYLRPQGERGARATAPSAPYSPSRPAPTASIDSGMIEALASLSLEPVRRARRIIGFRLPEALPGPFTAIGFEGGDILTAANGAPLTSFERLQELGEELAGASSVELEIERRGETRQVTVALRGNR